MITRFLSFLSYSQIALHDILARMSLLDFPIIGFWGTPTSPRAEEDLLIYPEVVSPQDRIIVQKKAALAWGIQALYQFGKRNQIGANLAVFIHWRVRRWIRKVVILVFEWLISSGSCPPRLVCALCSLHSCIIPLIIGLQTRFKIGIYSLRDCYMYRSIAPPNLA